MTTQDIVQQEVDSFMDAFYGYLLVESDYSLLPQEIRDIFHELTHDFQFDLSFALDGVEEEYLADYTYFRSESYNDEIYCSVPFGEIEIEKETWNKLDEESKDDWSVNENYCYHNLPAITIVYSRQKLIDIAKEELKSVK